MSNPYDLVIVLVPMDLLRFKFQSAYFKQGD